MSRTISHDRVEQEIGRDGPLPPWNHPHIVTIYEVDEAEGATFSAMERVLPARRA